MKFRKKPVVIEAVQWDGANIDVILDFCLTKASVRRAPEGQDTPARDTIAIDTLEGTMTAQRGDWIIKGVKGEFYPCKPDIFETSYEKVD
jgi:hypothetical protein